MFPAPHDALPLPPRPSLQQYRKLAKELVRAANSGDLSALAAWSKDWVDTLIRLGGLTISPHMPVRRDRWATQVEEFARHKLHSREGKPGTLAGAQFVLARVHGFESWAEFSRHIDELKNGLSITSQFEAAVDAIVDGDLSALNRLLRENPDLVRVRSTREHRAPLLHYVAANGVEGWRQRMPKNAVEIATSLLDADAEVDAVAEMYGGECTTLGLVATSVHPERAGVQIALMTLLLDRGARMDLPGSAGSRQSLLKACLSNGRGQAAEFLAARGAPLDLETAAGVGAIDVVKSYFDRDGKLKSGASQQQLRDGFLWACQFGRNRVVEFLIARGIGLSAQNRNGQTALHHVVIGAQLETMKLLLKHGAPLEVKNSYGGTVLGQAIWCAYNGDSPVSYLPAIEELLAAGAKVEPEFENELEQLLKRRIGK